jgi:hypothetical protein
MVTLHSSLRDFSMALVNPGLRPKLRSTVPVRQAQGRLRGTHLEMVVLVRPKVLI